MNGCSVQRRQQATALVSARPLPVNDAAPQIGDRLLASPATQSALMMALDAAAILLVLRWLQSPLWLLPLLQVCILACAGYKPLSRLRPERELAKLSQGLVAALLVAPVLVIAGSPIAIFLALPVAAVAAAISRTFLRCLYDHLWQHSRARQSAIIVGADLARQVEKLLRIQRHQGLQLLGYVEAAGTGPAVLPWLGDLSGLGTLLRQLRPQVLIVTESDHATGLADTREGRIEVCDQRGQIGPPRGCGRHQFLAPGAAATSAGVAALHSASKRGMDLVLGSIGCLVTLLLAPFIAAAIKLGDGGPVLYRQRYLAAPGKLAGYWKFRSMRVDAAEWLERDAIFRQQFQRKFKLEQDPRITRVGRFLRRYSLDELPQLYEVVRGRLSLVGPRTLSPAEGMRYGASLAKVLSVKPGVTGWWQVMGRQTTSHEERIAMDVFYVDHHTPWLDLWIAARTLWKVIAADGAY